MRPRLLLPLLVPLAFSCSDGDPTPTEIKPEFVPSCTPPKPTITPSPTSVTRTANTAGHQARFTVKNNCSVGMALDNRSSRTGSVTTVSTPSPATLILATGASATVTITYSVGAPGSGTVTLTSTTDADGAVSTGTQSVTVVAQSSAALRAGLWGLNANDLGDFPSTTSYYQAAQAVPNTTAGDPQNIDLLLSEANRLDITLVLRLSGNLGQYTNKDTILVNGQPKICSIYDSTKYNRNLERFETNTALRTALTSRPPRAIVFVIDEPHHADYCGSISEDDVKRMGAEIKSRWQGAITAVREPANAMVFGWNPKKTTPFSTSFWNTIDYGWSQYNHLAAVNQNTRPGEYYREQKDSLAIVNLGMIPGINVWNAGNKECWIQPDGRSGRIYGSDEEGVGGTFELCSSNPSPGNSISWVASPQLLKEAVDSAARDPDAPLFLGWTHVASRTGSSWAVMYDYERRPEDFKAAFEQWKTIGAKRTSWNGWRTAK